MPGSYVGTVVNSNTLALGVSGNYKAAYQAAAESTATGPLGSLIEQIPATADQIKLAAFEAAPLPAYWRRGRPAPRLE